MKTEPTALDREAAELFDCVDGMRAAWLCRGTAGVPRRLRYTWERICDDGKEPDAIDADDPATVGAMFAQVLELAKANNGDVSTTGYAEIGSGCGRLNFGIRVSVEPPGAVPPRPHQHAHEHIGAAIVSAMRSLQAAK